VQEQQTTITALQRANADLQARLARLEAVVAAATAGGVK